MKTEKDYLTQRVRNESGDMVREIVSEEITPGLGDVKPSESESHSVLAASL